MEESVPSTISLKACVPTIMHYYAIKKPRSSKWDCGIMLEEKKWDHGIKLEEKNADWEKGEKEIDRSFEMAKLYQFSLKEKIDKNYDLITQCAVTRKRTEGIGNLEFFFK
ncbi:hypothetical protein VP01_1769g2 [Puccinia sorghi]|uniref:Uncharacterized protein n=1 Tax=Puccinia sorghi TaxID=27349 RepID=A0A0L6VFE2_9BASI|nr:hypothetical protein VP01_1769g2 [Puccinia sorghi]